MRSRFSVLAVQAILAFLLVAGWEGAVRIGWLDSFFFPRPSDIAVQIAAWVVDPDFYTQIGVTLLEAMLAFLFGTALGVLIGLWLALAPFASRVLDPFLKVVNSIPKVILAPIFALWFGLGIVSKVALGLTLVFFVAFFNTYQGVLEVNPVVLSNARLLGASRLSLLRHVYLPSASTWIISSLRVSIGFAMIGAVVGEYLGSAAGMGHMIAAAQSTFDAVSVFAGVAVLSAFVLLVDALVSAVERRLLTWRPSQEPALRD